jgi:IrrE N-terminal-like domain
MMIISWMADGTGRFRERPFFSLEGMDRHCERIVQLHNSRLYGQPVPGLRTDGLIRMLNDYADLHLYADVSKYGAAIEAVTCFETGEKPTVRVARELFFDRSQNNHLRFVLAHEFAHARFHGAAWRRRWMTDEDLVRCSPNRMLTLDVGYDWFEWQANFLGASTLMPKSQVECVVAAYFGGEELTGVPRDSRDGHHLTDRVAELFEVSYEAANIRLCGLGYLVD